MDQKDTFDKTSLALRDSGPGVFNRECDPVAPGKRAWIAPGGSHWDRRVGDGHLRFFNVSLQHHHFGPREDAGLWKHRTF